MSQLAFTAVCIAGGLLATQAQAAAAAAYTLDPTHTTVVFEAEHAGLSTQRGRIDKKDGSVQFDRAGKSGRLDLTLDTASISTGIPAFDERLRGKDFFNTAEHPTARFVADRFSFSADRLSAIAGTLTLLGKTLPLTLTVTRFGCYANPLFRREVCGGDFEAVLLRSQWGMTHGLDAGLPDRIRLRVQAEAIKQE